MVHSLAEKRKVQPRCLQGEWVEEGVHIRNNSPQKLPELRNWRCQIPQKWDVRVMKVPVSSPCSQRTPLLSPIQETRAFAGETEPQMWGQQQPKSWGEMHPENKKIK